MIIWLLFISVAFGANELTSNGYSIGLPKANELDDPTEIDEKWMGYMIVAPATINLLGQVMVVASKVDVSMDAFSPNYFYKYIRHPKSFRATLLQISNGIVFFI